MLTAKVHKKFDLRKHAKNIKFGAAVGLTKTAKDGQGASIESIQSTFTTRGAWFKPSNKFGVRIKAAKKNDLVAQVKTAADWLALHETGGTKLPRGRSLAIPTANVRRTKRQIIQKSQRPRALLGKNTFVVKTKSGPVIFQRKGRGKTARIVALYNLEPKARIRKQSVFFEPIDRIVKRNINQNVRLGILRAFATSK